MKNTEQITDDIWTIIDKDDIESFQKIIEDDPITLEMVNEEGFSPIFYIGMKDALNCLRFLKEETDINILTPHPKLSINIFHFAALKGAINILNYFIEEKIINIDHVDMYDRSALHCSALFNEAEATQILLKGGCEKNLPDKLFSHTSLHYAARYGCAKVAQILLNAGCEKNLGDSNNFNPLHLAALSGDIKTLEILINFRCEFTLAGNYTPMEGAINENNLLIFKFLAEKIINQECTFKNYKVTNSSWAKWFYYAISKGAIDIIEYLLQSVQFTYNKEHVLRIAIEDKQWASLDYLLEEGKIDIDYLPDETNLNFTLTEGGLGVLRSLLGAKIIGLDFTLSNNSLLDLAINQGHLEKIKYLFEKKCKFSLSHIQVKDKQAKEEKDSLKVGEDSEISGKITAGPYEMADSFIKEKFSKSIILDPLDTPGELRLLKLFQFILNLPDYNAREPAPHIVAFNNYMAKNFLKLAGISKEEVNPDLTYDKLTLQNLSGDIQQTLFSFAPLYTIHIPAENQSSINNIETTGNSESPSDEST